MKYRIKVENLKNGTQVFYPQYKDFLFWNYFEFSDSWWADRNYVKCLTLEGAQNHIKSDQNSHISEQGKQVYSVSYVNFEGY